MAATQERPPANRMLWPHLAIKLVAKLYVQDMTELAMQIRTKLYRGHLAMKIIANYIQSMVWHTKSCGKPYPGGYLAKGMVSLVH